MLSLSTGKTKNSCLPLPSSAPLSLSFPTISTSNRATFYSNTALALALKRDGEKKGNCEDVAASSSRRKKQTRSPSSTLPDPPRLRDLVLAAASDTHTLSHRESIDKASLRIAREACWSAEKKRERKAAAAAAAKAAAKLVDRRKKESRRKHVEAARAAVVSLPGGASAVPASGDDDDDDDDDADESGDEEAATLVASVQLAVKHFLVGEAKEKRQQGRGGTTGEAGATALPVVVVGVKEKELGKGGENAAAAASLSYLAAVDDDCLLFSAAEELRMPFFSSAAAAAAGAAEESSRQRKTALEVRGERASAVAPAALALAEALRLPLA